MLEPCIADTLKAYQKICANVIYKYLSLSVGESAVIYFG